MWSYTMENYTPPENFWDKDLNFTSKKERKRQERRGRDLTELTCKLSYDP